MDCKGRHHLAPNLVFSSLTSYPFGQLPLDRSVIQPVNQPHTGALVSFSGSPFWSDYFADYTATLYQITTIVVDWLRTGTSSLQAFYFALPPLIIRVQHIILLDICRTPLIPHLVSRRRRHWNLDVLLVPFGSLLKKLYATGLYHFDWVCISLKKIQTVELLCYYSSIGPRGVESLLETIRVSRKSPCTRYPQMTKPSRILLLSSRAGSTCSGERAGPSIPMVPNPVEILRQTRYREQQAELVESLSEVPAPQEEVKPSGNEESQEDSP